MAAGKALERLVTRFDTFLGAVWKVLRLPPPDPIQVDIAQTLQYGPDRLVIQAFRGVGKSYIAGTFVAWSLLRNPDLAALMVSASRDKAGDLSQFVLKLLQDCPFLEHLAPDGTGRSSMAGFDVRGARPKQSPSVRSKGITGTITGGRAGIILADDIEVPQNAQTLTMREKIRGYVREFDNIISPGPGNRIIYLGTPQLEDSLYSELPQAGYETRIWTIRFPTPKEVDRYGGRLAPAITAAITDDPSLEGKPTEPRRFGEDVILEKEVANGRLGFQLQYMLDTSLADADRNPLKLRDLTVMALNPERGPSKVVWAASPEYKVQDLPTVGLRGDAYYGPMTVDGPRDDNQKVIWQPYTGMVMAIDPSGRGKDETGYAVTGFLNGQVFLLAAGGFAGGYEEATLKKLADVAKRFQVKRILHEANFGDGMWGKLFTPVLQRIYPCTLEEVKASNRAFKEQRICDILEPVLSQHRLIVDRKVIEDDFRSTQTLPPEEQLARQAFYQLTRITRDRGALRHDDRLEAIAWAVWYWTQHMAADVDKRLDAEKERLFDEALRAFDEATYAYSAPRGDMWSPL